MGNTNKFNIAYIGATPAYYFVPFLRKLANHNEINLVVHWLSDEAVRDYHENDLKTTMKAVDGLLCGYNYTIEKNLIGVASYQNGFFGLNSIGPINKILSKKYDAVIIHGWQYITNILVIVACRISKTKLLLRAETPLIQELRKPKWKLILRKFILRVMFKLVDRILYIGKENYAFYRHYGVKKEKLFFAPYCVDNELITNKIEDARKDKLKIKNKYDLIDGKINIIFIGKLQHKKRPTTLINAYNAIKNNDSSQLLIIGSGELESELKLLTKGSQNIKMFGYKSQEEIFELLAVSDIFVLPSGDGETWGLVTNEALNAGIPIIISDRVGSARDLATNANGIIFKLDDESELTKAIDLLLSDAERRRSMGKCSIELLKIYDPRTVVEGIVNSIKSCYKK
jgi:glycosyltransferase involved in cell wall biosynthesis